MTPISFFIQRSLRWFLTILPSFNFRDTQYMINTSLQKVPAVEQRNSQLDTDIRRHPKNSPPGELPWQGQQQIDGDVRNETTEHCVNCHLLVREYGHVLFERDLAQRYLRLTNYRLGNELQRQRNRKNNGMDLELLTYLVIYA